MAEGAPPTRWAKTDIQLAVDLHRKGSDFRDRFGLVRFPSFGGNTTYFATRADLEVVFPSSVEDWPEDHILFPVGDPLSSSPNPGPRPSFDGVPPQHVFVRGESDPISMALDPCGAKRVDSRHFLMPDGLGELIAPLAKSPFEGWQVHGRPAQHNQDDWMVGAR